MSARVPPDPEPADPLREAVESFASDATDPDDPLREADESFAIEETEFGRDPASLKCVAFTERRDAERECCDEKQF